MKKYLRLIILSIIFLSINNNVFAKSELKIGAILPLSGEHETIGKNIYQSILITIFELKNLNIKIIPLDTQSSSDGAINAFKEGLNKKVDVFIGPVFFKTLNEIKNVDGFKDQLFISYSNQENNTFSNVINFGVNLDSQMNALARYFNGNDQFIFFGDNTPFTKKVLQKTKKFKSKNTSSIFYKDFKDMDTQITKITNFIPRNKRHLAKIKKLETAYNEQLAEKIENPSDKKIIEDMQKHDTSEKVKFKKVLISSFDEELIAALSYFDFYDANYQDVQFITLNLWFNKKYLKEPSLENIIFPSIDYSGYNELNSKYRKNFKRDIYHLESLTFDMIPLIASTWFQRKDTKLKASMFNGSYKGKTGEFIIKENKANRKLFLYKIEDKKFKKI